MFIFWKKNLKKKGKSTFLGSGRFETSTSLIVNKAIKWVCFLSIGKPIA